MIDNLVGKEDRQIRIDPTIPKQKLTLEKTKDLIEVISKFVIGVLAVCYGLGLLVVNVHLSSYRVFSLSLFRLRALFAPKLCLGLSHFSRRVLYFGIDFAAR